MVAKSMKGNNPDFRSFLSLLQQEGELVRVKRDVSAEFELAAVTAKMDGKQAVLFEKVRGSRIGVACNVVGTAKKFYLAVAGTRKAGHADVKKAIHARITEALASLSAPTKIQGG
ncbi:MAG TPA: UbiD family decarboxylase, partial [Nitrososphaera sp.]|nr:UbiD family decarboxylase [Nitrososphaera sp.]